MGNARETNEGTTSKNGRVTQGNAHGKYGEYRGTHDKAGEKVIKLHDDTNGEQTANTHKTRQNPR